MQLRDDFAHRKEVLWKILLEKPREELKWGTVRTELEKRGGGKVNHVKLEYAIRMLRRDRVQKPNELKIIGAGASGDPDDRKIILHLRESDAERRERDETEQKSAITAGVWYVLLGKCPDEEDTSSVLMPDPERWPEHTRNKLCSMRNRSFATLALDSGSTVRALSRGLLDKGSIPFPAFYGPFPSQRAQSPKTGESNPPPKRDVTPTVITNSPQLAVDLLGTPHFNQVEVRMVGGALSGDSMSTAGSLAEDCLMAWGYSGKFVGVDFAVLGARGFKPSLDGVSGFTVMHLSQAQIKMRFFALAAVRCIAMSSSKLPEEKGSSGGDGVCRFARLDGAEVDIVFTDASHAEAAASFACEAFRNGVMPVIAAADAEQERKVIEALKKERYADIGIWAGYSTSSKTGTDGVKRVADE